MKKAAILFLLVSVLVPLLAACASETAEIEDYEWQMRCIVHAEDDRVVYDAAESDAYPDATVLRMTLVARDGRLTLTDHTGGKIYEGVYTVSQRTPAGTDYHVTIDGISGHATVAMTTYADGTAEPTLPIGLGDYSLYFYAN